MATKYWKAPDGAIWGGDTIVTADKLIVNPTREQLLAAGYTEHEHEEQAVTVADNKRDMRRKAYAYADELRRVQVNGKSVRFDDIDKVLNAVESVVAIGKTTVKLWIDGELLECKADTALQMLRKVSVHLYEVDCACKAVSMEINKADTADTVAAIDITAGYPQPISFEL